MAEAFLAKPSRKERKTVSEDKSYDIDVATAAEQSSEEDEAQEGMVLDQQEHSSDSAEHEAMHIVDDESVNVEEALEALESSPDEEADAVVEDALDIDSPEEANAAAEATEDEADSTDRGDLTEAEGDGAELDRGGVGPAHGADTLDNFGVKREIGERHGCVVPGSWGREGWLALAGSEQFDEAGEDFIAVFAFQCDGELGIEEAVFDSYIVAAAV